MAHLQDPPVAFADWRHDPTITFADAWKRADEPWVPTPAERRTFEAIDTALQTMGLIIELDEHGRPFPADEVDDPMFRPRTPDAVADALARVDQAAEQLRRERHRETARVRNLPAPRPAIATMVAKCSPRSRESRPSRARRTATAAASSGDDPGPPGEPPSPALAGHRALIAGAA